MLSVGLEMVCGGMASLAVGDATIERGGGELTARMGSLVVGGDFVVPGWSP